MAKNRVQTDKYFGLATAFAAPLDLKEGRVRHTHLLYDTYARTYSHILECWFW